MIHRKQYSWTFRAETTEIVESKSITKPWFGEPKEVINHDYVHHRIIFNEFVVNTMTDINKISKTNTIISISEHTEAEDRLGDDRRTVIVLFYNDNKND